jgi:hypothetical protein
MMRCIANRRLYDKAERPDFSKRENRQALLDELAQGFNLSVLTAGFNFSSLSEGNEAGGFDELAKMDDFLINIGLCDLLRDVAKTTKRKREEFYDQYGLRRCRLVGSLKVGHSNRRDVETPQSSAS